MICRTCTIVSDSAIAKQPNDARHDNNITNNTIKEGEENGGNCNFTNKEEEVDDEDEDKDEDEGGKQVSWGGITPKCNSKSIMDDIDETLEANFLIDGEIPSEDEISMQVERVLGSDYQNNSRTLQEVLSAMSKILDVYPWDPTNIDETVVQMLLHVLRGAQQSEEFELSFFQTIADNVGGPKWMANEKAGYGKAFILTDKNIKAGLYRWNKGCIAGIHDHGTETVAIYAAVGRNSRLLNKVYEKLPTDEDSGTCNIAKEYEEILDGSSSNPVVILRPHHAHAIQNLSPGYSYTLHIYVPSYDFGLAWDYEDRASVNFIRQSMLAPFQDLERGPSRYNKSGQNGTNDGEIDAYLDILLGAKLGTVNNDTPVSNDGLGLGSKKVYNHRARQSLIHDG